jgi:hypothetical protein
MLLIRRSVMEGLTYRRYKSTTVYEPVPDYRGR